MIRLTRLNGSEFYLNPDLIEALEETPDTQVTLANGQHYVVRERIEIIEEMIVLYNARVLRRSYTATAQEGYKRRRPRRKGR